MFICFFQNFIYGRGKSGQLSMRKALRLTICIRWISLLCSWGIRTALLSSGPPSLSFSGPSEMPGLPSFCSRLSLKEKPDPQRSAKKGKANNNNGKKQKIHFDSGHFRLLRSEMKDRIHFPTNLMAYQKWVKNTKFAFKKKQNWDKSLTKTRQK